MVELLPQPTDGQGPALSRSHLQRHWPYLAVMTVLLTVLSYGLTAFYFWQPFQGAEQATAATALDPLVRLNSDRAAKQERINLLMLGTDADGERTDVMIVASIDPGAQSIRLLSLPRDTKVPIFGRYNGDGTQAVEKIAHAHVYETKDLTGNQRAMRTVSDFLGIPIHKYVLINLSGFIKIVDALGGVDVDVPMEMNYDDPYQNLHIHLKKGPQHLNGQEAMGLVRFRHNNSYTRGYEDGDLGRIRVQQQVVLDLARRATSAQTLPKLPLLVDQLIKYVRTDLTKGELLGLLQLGTKVNLSTLDWQTLPGTLGGGADFGYYLPDHTQLKSVVDQLLRRQSYP